MTMMVRYLAILGVGLRVSDLTENWRREVRSFEEHRLNSWISAPPELDGRPRKQLDWGTMAVELEEPDLTVLAGNDDLSGLPPLAPGERRVALWVEIY